VAGSAAWKAFARRSTQSAGGRAEFPRRGRERSQGRIRWPSGARQSPLPGESASL